MPGIMISHVRESKISNHGHNPQRYPQLPHGFVGVFPQLSTMLSTSLVDGCQSGLIDRLS